MIIEHIGDLLSVEEGIIVHGCNCEGVMGSGIAKSIRDKWPEVYTIYKEYERRIGLFLGSIQSIPVDETVLLDINHYSFGTLNLPDKIIVVNAMTQNTFGRDPAIVYVDYDAISACFAQIKILAKKTGLPVHFPLIGCGLANGDWEEVSSRIEAALGPDIEKHVWRL